FFHVPGAGNAENHRAENDRADQHLHERDEAVSQGLQLHGPGGIHVAKQSAAHACDQNTAIQMVRQPSHAGTVYRLCKISPLYSKETAGNLDTTFPRMRSRPPALSGKAFRKWQSMSSSR